MVCAIRDVTGAIMGVQRVFLAHDGNGKADVSKPKLSLGRVAGGAIRMGDLDTSGIVTVCEGPEDGLSLVEMLGGPVWVAAGSGMMSAMQFPIEVQRVVIGADNDDAGFMADPLSGDTGFLPRCLICEPASTIGTRLYDASVRNDEPLRSFNARLRDIVETPMPMDPETRELQPRRLPLSQEARQALIAYSDRVERSQAAGGDCEAIKGTASKSAEQAARIAGVLTMWADLDALEVTGKTMESAVRLATFYLTEAQRLASVAVVSASVAKAEKLRRWLLSGSWGEPWITIREIMRGPLRERPEAQAAVSMLVEAGWLVALPAGIELDGQKRKEAWRIVRN